MSAPDGPWTRWSVRPDEAGRTLLEVVRGRVPHEPLERVLAAIRTRVRLSWTARVGPDVPVAAHGAIELGPEPLEETADDTAIPVLATGDGWLAIDKPPGCPVHPTRSVRINSVIERVRRARGERDLRLAHRLDRDTSGVLLLARDRPAAARLGRAFAAGAVHKEYLAVVRGVPAARSGVIDRPVGRDERSDVRVRMAVGAGQPAVTRWEVLRPVAGGTLVRVVPETGRRHQIRVHLESIGHPILGDILYGRPDGDYLALVAGRDDPRRDDGGPRRMLLHCARLRLGWPGLRFDIRAPFEAEREVHDPAQGATDTA